MLSSTCLVLLLSKSSCAIIGKREGPGNHSPGPFPASPFSPRCLTSPSSALTLFSRGVSSSSNSPGAASNRSSSGSSISSEAPGLALYSVVNFLYTVISSRRLYSFIFYYLCLQLRFRSMPHDLLG